MTGTQRTAVRAACWRLHDLIAWIGESRPRDDNLAQILYEVYGELLEVRRTLLDAANIPEVPPSNAE